MQLSIEDWMKDLTEKLKRQFGQRLLFVGLQGSYQRGEATADSDIDVVVLLDTLSFQDLSLYRDIIQHMPHSKLACGFISGKAEIQHWPSYDLFQFVHDTRAYYGSLEEIVGDVDQYAADALRVGAANLYHAACHSYLFEMCIRDSCKAMQWNLYRLLLLHWDCLGLSLPKNSSLESPQSAAFSGGDRIPCIPSYNQRPSDFLLVFGFDSGSEFHIVLTICARKSLLSTSSTKK